MLYIISFNNPSILPFPPFFPVTQVHVSESRDLFNRSNQLALLKKPRALPSYYFLYNEPLVWQFYRAWSILLTMLIFSARFLCMNIESPFFPALTVVIVCIVDWKASISVWNIASKHVILSSRLRALHFSPLWSNPPYQFRKQLPGTKLPFSKPILHARVPSWPYAGSSSAFRMG